MLQCDNVKIFTMLQCNVQVLLVTSVVSSQEAPDLSQWYSLHIHWLPSLSTLFLCSQVYQEDGWLVVTYIGYSSCRTPLINLEDVFLTGLCARQQLGLKFTNNKKFIPRGPKSVNGKNICVFKRAVVVHNKYKPEMLDRLWSLTTQKKSSSCHK